jgi:mRNA interferase MazF
MESLSVMRVKVVLVPFQFDDLSGQKVRPAVCLTEAIGAHRHVVIAFITSTVPGALEATDILLTPGTPEFTPTGLRVVSTLRLHRMVTVTTKIIRRQLGVLAPATCAAIDTRLRTLFAI